MNVRNCSPEGATNGLFAYPHSKLPDWKQLEWIPVFESEFPIFLIQDPLSNTLPDCCTRRIVLQEHSIRKHAVDVNNIWHQALMIRVNAKYCSENGATSMGSCIYGTKNNTGTWSGKEQGGALSNKKRTAVASISTSNQWYQTRMRICPSMRRHSSKCSSSRWN